MRGIAIALLLAASAAAHTGNGIVADPATRTIYFTDALRSCVWRLDASHRLDCFAGDRHGNNLARDAAGNLYIDNFNRELWKISPGGRQTRILDGQRIGGLDELLAVDAGGNLYLAGGNDFDGHRPVLLKRSPEGAVTTIAGSERGHADGQGEEARFNALHSAAPASDGSLYISDAHSIRRVSPGGAVTTVAGAEMPGYRDGRAADARFTALLGLALDSHGNIYVADSGNQCVRRISAQGTVSTVLRPDGAWTPVAVAVSAEDICVLERKFLNVIHDLQLGQDQPRVVKIAPGGKREVVVTIKGETFAGAALIALPVGLFLAVVLLVRFVVRRIRNRRAQLAQCLSDTGA